MSDNKIEFKIKKDKNRQDVSLHNMSSSALESFTVFLSALNKIIKNTPNSENIKFEISEGSACISAVGIADNQYMELERTFNDVVENKSENKELVDSWRTVQNTILLNGLEYEAFFIKDEEKKDLLEIFKTKPKFRVKRQRRESEYSLVFFIGKLIAVGGKVPNMHVECTNGEVKIIRCSEAEAKIVEGFLYTQVRLSIWSKNTIDSKSKYFFCDLYVNENHYNDFRGFIAANGNQEIEEVDYLVNIHNKLRGYLDKGEYGVANKFLRFFNHESVDVGSLKTILVITKNFKDNEKIKDLRGKIKSILESKLKHPII